MIKDSGERVQYSTGAVRDIKEGKGRCDLLPLSVVAQIMYYSGRVQENILADIEKFQITADINYLCGVFNSFVDKYYDGNKTEALLEVSIHYEEGAVKYKEWNWTKGIPLWSFISSAVRHYLKVEAGYSDESHIRAFMWNILGAIWTVLNRPDMCQMLSYEQGYLPLWEDSDDIGL